MNRRAIALLLLALGGLSALGFGLFGFFRPEATAEAVSLLPENAFGLGEIRALYGGLWTAMGVMVLSALLPLSSRGAMRPAVDTRAIERIRTIALCWTGLPIARSISTVMDGSDGGSAVLYISVEFAMVAALLGGLALLPSRRA